MKWVASISAAFEHSTVPVLIKKKYAIPNLKKKQLLCVLMDVKMPSIQAVGKMHLILSTNCAKCEIGPNAIHMKDGAHMED